MKLIRLFAPFLLVHGAVASEKPSADREKIDAVLALFKSSLSLGPQDKAEALKNAMILLSKYKEDQETLSVLSELMSSTEEAIEMGEDASLHQCPSSDAEEIFTNYADRHVHRLEEIVNDYDCMEREFDVSDREFDPEEAAFVYNKCRLLVLRNVFPKKDIEEYRRKYEDYILAVHTGAVDKSNTKTTDAGTRDIVQYRGRMRHDVMLPKWLGGKDIAGNEKILEILRQEQLLGPDMVLNQVGSVISEAGAPPMYWHIDQDYIFSGSSFENSGIGGHDLLPYVVDVFIPLLNTTLDHGPTEYCVGSSLLSGLPKWPSVMDETLTKEESRFHQMYEFTERRDACPPEHWRVPLVGMGDVVLSDYHIYHRGGANVSPELRSLLYVIYSRFWFRDYNFDDNAYAEEESEEESDGEESDSEFEALAKGMRYVLIDESDIEHLPKARETVASLNSFAGIGNDVRQFGRVRFPFTNIDVEGASLFLDGKQVASDIRPKTKYDLKANIGQELSARDKDGNLIKKWKICADQEQTILLNSA